MKTKYFELTLSDDYKQYVTESELEDMIEDCMRYDGIIPFSRRQISREEFRIGRLEQRVEELEEKLEQVAGTYTPPFKYRTRR